MAQFYWITVDYHAQYCIYVLITNYIETQEPTKGSFFYFAATGGLFLRRNYNSVLTFEAKG